MGSALASMVPSFDGHTAEDRADAEIAAIIRGQGDMLMAQGRGPMPGPQNFMNDSSPQGNPLTPGVRSPDPNDWVQVPPPEFIDIDAYVAEARTGRLMFGVGVNSDAGVIGNIVLSENNFNIRRPPTSIADIMNGTAFRGAGEKFRIEALPGSEVSRYLVDWQNPYFLDSDVNLGVSGFYYTRFFRFWDEQRIGGRVRIGRQFTQAWAANIALRLENVSITDEFQPAPPSLAAAVGDSLLSTVRVGLSHDTRDAAFLPTSGHFIEFGVEQAFNEYNYTRLEVEGRQYFTTYQRPDGAGKHVVNLHGNFGWTSSNTPIFERFYAGGFQSFRGFAFRGVTPLENGVEVGGEFMLIGSVEYQVPVLANEMLKVVAFSDFGTVEEDVQFDNFRLAVGGGLRIQVPGMGPVPVALDWAVPVIKSDFDRTQLFSFYIGINR
jgi:outer membrane protein insertion porin family